MLIQGLLNWLPLASPTFNSYKHEHQDSLKRLVNLTPYCAARSSREVEAELPGDCSVNRVVRLHRHGSRGPYCARQTNVINSIVQKLRNGYGAIQHAHLPEDLRFLEKGYESHLEPEKLTIIGSQQLLNHGVEFGLKYPNFNTATLLSSNAPRVIDSMYFFALGRFGREVQDEKLLTVNDMPDPVSWITPWTSCPGPNWYHSSEASDFPGYVKDGGLEGLRWRLTVMERAVCACVAVCADVCCELDGVDEHFRPIHFVQCNYLVRF
ncbi:histidine phosphatase superfamily [Suillus ampliporus]|nr:histidine phosphatase superfamily [Suillus ampliporus]